MPRTATYEFGAINITLAKHSPHLYSGLFKKAYGVQKPTKLRGETFGRIHTMFEVAEGKPELGLHGDLIKYTAIDPKDPWFDIEKGKEATKEQKVAISIPAGLAPNMKWTRYVFDSVHHRFIWIAAGPNISFSPFQMEKVLINFLTKPSVVDEFGLAEIIIEQDRDKLEQILNLFKLEKLYIEYARPNPDDDDEDLAEKAVAKRLEVQHIQKVQTGYIAEKNHSIEPDKNTRALARLAASNGYVCAKGRDISGKKIEENTTEHPWTARVKGDSTMLNLGSWLITLLPNLLKKLLR